MKSFKDQIRLLLPGKMKGYLLNRMKDLFSPALAIVARDSISYYEDGLLLEGKNAEFLANPLFVSSYLAGESTGSWNNDVIRWRIHILCWAARHAVHLAGDFVECGVNKGGSALAVTNYVDFGKLDKKFYLLDTYDGIVDEDISDEERSYGIDLYKYEDCYELVKVVFQEYQNIEIIRGRVPDTLRYVDTQKVCYLHIDMNNAAPEIAAGEFFWDRLVGGALVLLDDYGFSKHYVQKRAWDRFAAQHDVEVLTRLLQLQRG